MDLVFESITIDFFKSICFTNRMRERNEKKFAFSSPFSWVHTVPTYMGTVTFFAGAPIRRCSVVRGTPQDGGIKHVPPINDGYLPITSYSSRADVLGVCVTQYVPLLVNF
jgi:hypothetical protein